MKVSYLQITLGLVAASPFITSLSAPSLYAENSSPFSEKAEFVRYAERLRESVIQSLEPEVRTPTTNSTTFSSLLGANRFPWKTNIVTTTFWVGEAASTNNPVHNRSSSWDLTWRDSFGGFDNPDPAKRRGYFPTGFIPKLNPFYIALPYNDVSKGGFKPEARSVIPWFKQSFVKEGQSVCRDRWVAIRNRSGKVCYAQWSDCGPFRTDHWQYVFGRERPAPNLNGGAGLDVSPAVRDYLKLSPTDVTDWKFVEFNEIPRGPWSEFGENNDFVQQARRSRDRMATNPVELPNAPKVLIR